MRSRFLAIMGVLTLASCAHRSDRDTDDNMTGTRTTNRPVSSSRSAGVTNTQGGPADSDRGYTQTSPGTTTSVVHCPMELDGTSVRSEDVPGGIALIFSTTGSADELRRSVNDLAQQHRSRISDAERQMFQSMPAVDVDVEDVDGGAKLVLKPKDAHHLARLRERVRDDAIVMASGQCPMMEMRAERGTDYQSDSEYRSDSDYPTTTEDRD